MHSSDARVHIGACMTNYAKCNFFEGIFTYNINLFVKYFYQFLLDDCISFQYSLLKIRN